MRSYDERLGQLQRRARALRKRQRKTALLVSGSCATALLALLAMFTVQLTGPSYAIAGGGFAGASLLSEKTGAFVLTAVLAFMAGALATILIRNWKERGQTPPKNGTQPNKKSKMK